MGADDRPTEWDEDTNRKSLFPAPKTLHRLPELVSATFQLCVSLNNYHGSDALLLSLPSESARTIADSDTEEMVDETPLPLIHRPTGRQCMLDLQHEASTLLASLRANSSIPYCVIPEIIQSLDSMIDMTLNSLQSETVKLLSVQTEKS